MKKIVLLFLPLLLLCSNMNAANQPERASSVWFLMEQQDNKRQRPNDSVIFSYKITNELIYDYYTTNMCYLPHVAITIQNYSERTIYIDLQNSFIVVSGETYPLFTNTTAISTQGSTTIGGVGLGVVGVGTASSNYNTTIKQEQRILTVPSDSKIEMNFPFITKWGTSWKLNNGYGKVYMVENLGKKPAFPVLHQEFINNGELLSYNSIIDSPFNLDFRMSYAYSEDLKNAATDKTVYYTKHAIGTDYRGRVGVKDYLNLDYRRVKDIFPQLDSYVYDSSHKRDVVHLWKSDKKRY